MGFGTLQVGSGLDRFMGMGWTGCWIVGYGPSIKVVFSRGKTLSICKPLSTLLKARKCPLSLSLNTAVTTPFFSREIKYSGTVLAPPCHSSKTPFSQKKYYSFENPFFFKVRIRN